MNIVTINVPDNEFWRDTLFAAITSQNAKLTTITPSITSTLSIMGLSMKHIGYTYLQDVVNYCLESSHKPSLVDEVYPTIASLHGTSSLGVERSIRYAIERAWDDKMPEVAQSWGYNWTTRPTNATLIAAVMEVIKNGGVEK